jgi:hypothetical protein
MIKIDIRIKWNKIFRDEIEKKLNKRKIKKNSNQNNEE